MSAGLNDLREYHPEKTPAFKATLQKDKEGVSYYVVNNGINDKYIRLSELCYLFFLSMDGKTPLGHIADKVFMNKNKPDDYMIIQFLSLLYKNDFLLIRSSHEMSLLVGYRERIGRFSRKNFRMTATMKRLFKAKIAYKSVDPVITWLYNNLGRIFFTKISAVLSSLVTLAGGIYFTARIVSSQCGAGILSSAGKTLLIHIVPGIAGIMMSLILHELAHAVTCKHYGCKVSSLGVKMNYGFPVFFADTTDSWVLPRNQRMMIAASGIILNIVLGAVFSVISGLSVPHVASRIFMLWALINFGGGLINLIPFIKYDGYYIISDYLERPNLRDEAFALVFSLEVWKDIFDGKKQSGTCAWVFIFGLCYIMHSCVMGGLIILSIFILSSAYLSAPLDLYAAFVASVAMLLLPAGGGIKKVMKAKVFDGGRFKNADGYKTD